MSEAVRDVNYNGDSSTPNGSESSGGDPSSSSEGQDNRVPYDRFKEVNDKARTYEQQLAQFQQRDAQWAARDAALQQQMQQMLKAQADRQRPVDQSQQSKPDPTEQLIRQQLGNDEAGKQAYETLQRHFEHQYAQRAGNLVTKEELARRDQAVHKRVMDELASTFGTSNRFTEWEKKGMITPAQSAELQVRLNQALKQYPDLASRPRDLKAYVSELLVEEMEQGKIKPFSERPKNPISAGASGAPLNEPPPLEPGKSNFGRLRNMKPETAKRLMDISLNRHSGANG